MTVKTKNRVSRCPECGSPDRTAHSIQADSPVRLIMLCTICTLLSADIAGATYPMVDPQDPKSDIGVTIQRN